MQFINLKLQKTTRKDVKSQKDLLNFSRIHQAYDNILHMRILRILQLRLEFISKSRRLRKRGEYSKIILICIVAKSKIKNNGGTR